MHPDSVNSVTAPTTGSSDKTISPSTTFDLGTHTFLVGDTIALRPVTKEDAPYTSSWRESIGSLSPETTVTWIEDAIGGDAGNPYLVVRKDDGRPVGLLTLDGTFPGRNVKVFIDPRFGDRAITWKIEVFQLIVPWQIDEKHMAILRLSFQDDEPEVLTALIGDGWRESARFPAFRWSSSTGKWVDLLLLEYLSSQWLALLGDPGSVVLARSGTSNATGEPRPVPAPVKLPDALPVKLPKQAIMIGTRVYLRPLNKDDALTISELTREEPDPVWAIGRRLAYPQSFAQWVDKLQEKEPQTWVRFAICLRETDEIIGTLGLYGINYTHGFAESESEINHPAYRGAGYGSEAKHLLFSYAFDTLGLHALHSWVIFPNMRSAAALRKQGYQEAGRVNWAYPIDGGFGNAVVFSLHADDWWALPRIDAASIPSADIKEASTHA